jgi:hypothetical protein
MTKSSASTSPAPPHTPGRIGRIAWRAGWVLLAAVSMTLAYAGLVVAGR